jgi:hypothetical protein
MGEFLAPKTGGEPEGCDCIVAVTTSSGGITETSRPAGLKFDSPRATSDVICMDRGRPEKLEFEDGGDERFVDPNGTPTRIAMTIPPVARFLTDPPLILGDVLATTSSIWACFHDLRGPFVAAASVLCCSTACLAAICCKCTDDFRIRASRSVRIRVISVRTTFTCAGPTASLDLQWNCCSID